jgi:hypothetical protein
MGSKGSNTTTSSSAPPPWLSSAYQDVLGRATSAANQPYQAYTGELVAPVNAEEQAGIGGINQYANWAQPYYNAAAGYATSAAQPLTQSQIQQYQNPFTQQVGGATEQWLANLNAQQDQQVLGNAVSQGAWGGDRAEIARANLAGQQTAAAAPTLAGIASQGYTQGVQTAEQQQQNQAQAAYSLGSLGTQAQQAGLTGAGAQIQGGQLQQGTQQALNQAQMQQFYTAQGYPFQVASYLAGIAGGLGGVAGGTSETTKPAPNPFAPYLGIAATAAGAYMGVARGGGIGPMQHFDAGGAPSVPYSGGINFIPSIQIHPGGGPPKPPDTGEEKPSSLTGGDSLGKGLGQWLSKRNGISTSGSGFPMEGSADAENLIYEAHGGGVGLGDIGQGFAGDDYGGDLTANPWPRPNDYVGSDQPIDASDIVLKGGTGGLGLGEKYEPTNAAIQADDGIGAINKALRQTPPSRAMGFAGSPNVAEGIDAPAYAPTSRHPPPTGVSAENFTPQRPDDTRTWQQRLSLPLMQAGLALMANRSPYLGEAIGTAGLAGISGYLGQERERRSSEEKQQDVEQKGAQLSELAQYHRDIQDRADKTLEQAQLTHGYERMPDGSVRAIPGGPADPATVRAQAVAKRVPGMDDDALHTMVQAYRGGNTGVLSGISRGVSGPDNLNRFWNMLSTDLKAEGATGTDLNAAKANFMAQSAAARTAAQREATISTAVNEAKGTFPLVLQRSLELPRTNYVPVNTLLKMWREGTSSPEQGRLAVALQGAITAYSQAMSRTGANTVFAQQHAESLLSGVTSHEALAARIEQMQQEMGIAEQAPEQTRKGILDRILGRPPGEIQGKATAPAGTTLAPPPPDIAGQYRAAIAAGKPKALLDKRLQEQGYSPP